MVDLTRQSFYLARVVKTRWLCPRIKTTGAYRTPLKAPTCLTPSKTPQISLGLSNETSVGKVPKRIPQPILLGRNSLILRVSSIWFDGHHHGLAPTNQPQLHRSMIFPEISQQSHHNALGIVGQVIFALISATKKTTQSVPVLPRFHGNVDGI